MRPTKVALQRRVVRTLAAFAFALKHQLRGTDRSADLACRLDRRWSDRVCGARFVPSACCCAWPRISPPPGARAPTCSCRPRHQPQPAHRSLRRLRAHRQHPIPTYRVLMNRTVMVYCLLLPVGLANAIGWPCCRPFIAHLPGAGRDRRADRGALRQRNPTTSPGAMCHGIELSICELVGEQPLSGYIVLNPPRPTPMKPRSAIKTDLFADELHRKKIDTLGDPLAEIESYIDFAALAAEVDRIAPRRSALRVAARRIQPRRWCASWS